MGITNKSMKIAKNLGYARISSHQKLSTYAIHSTVRMSASKYICMDVESLSLKCTKSTLSMHRKTCIHMYGSEACLQGPLSIETTVGWFVGHLSDINTPLCKEHLPTEDTTPWS